MYEEIIQKIKALGLDDEKANEMFELLSGEIIENIFNELSNISTEEEMQVFETRLQEAKAPEHFQNIINEIALKVYGDDAEKEIKENFELLINEIQKNIQQARELIQNQSPEAQALLKKGEQTEIAQSINNQQV